jgi:hypothetical protein
MFSYRRLLKTKNLSLVLLLAFALMLAGCREKAEGPTCPIRVGIITSLTGA